MKREAAGGHDQFGGSLLKARARGAEKPVGRVTPVTFDELEGCFDSLDTEATTWKTTLDELVKTNFALTSSIAELAATNTQLTKDVARFSQEVNK